MSRSLASRAGAALLLPLLAGCLGVSAEIGSGGTTFGPAAPFPYPPGSVSPGDPDSPSGMMIQHVCRASGTRTGWIAIQYAAGGECPSAPDGDPFNVAIIERYREKPIGATMEVCADQTVPRGWHRERNRRAVGECPGARVRQGEPTMFVIRRVS